MSSEQGSISGEKNDVLDQIYEKQSVDFRCVKTNFYSEVEKTQSKVKEQSKRYTYDPSTPDPGIRMA